MSAFLQINLCQESLYIETWLLENGRSCWYLLGTIESYGYDFVRNPREAW